MGELMDVLDPALSSASRPKTHYRGQPLKPGAKPEARTEAGVRPHNEVLFLLNLLGYEILHLGRVLMEQATRRGWSLRRFRERVLRVASGATSGEAIDFRHQSRGDGLEAVVAETGAGVLGAGIVDGGGIGPMEGSKTVGISHRRVNLSAGDGRPVVNDWFSSGADSVESTERETGHRPHENIGLEALINMSHGEGRRLIFVISQGATDWKRLWQRLARVSWAPG